MLITLKRCLLLLDARARRRWVGLVPFVMVSALLETVGAASVFALVKIVSDPAHARQLPGLSAFLISLPWQDEQSILVSCTLAVALFYVFKNSLLIVIAYLQSQVVARSTVALSRQLLKGYLLAPYAFHLRRNSAELIHNINNSADTAMRFVLAPAVAMMSESLVVAGLILMLLLAAPGVTLAAVIVLGGLFTLMLRVTKQCFLRWGDREQQLRQALLQTLQQSLGGIKEIQVMGCEHFFYETFSALQQSLARVFALRATLSATPHVFVETVFVCGVLAVVLLVASQGGLQGDLLPLLGLYAYVGFRIIPSSNRIILYVNLLRSSAAAVDLLARDLQLFQREADESVRQTTKVDVALTESVTLEALSFCYDGATEPALRDITVRIRRGEAIGIVGPTGSGKSTLTDLILGLLQPSAGRITVDGHDVASCKRAWQRQIGYVPQSVYLTDDTLQRNIALGVEDGQIDEWRLRNAVRMAQLEQFIASLPEGLETVVGEHGVRLSGGERQRVAIARALYHEPAVLIFDEATSALDNQTEREVTRAIEALQGQKTVFVIAHRLSTVRHCDHLLFLQKGRLAGWGTFTELREQNPDFRALAALVDTVEDAPSA